MREEYIETVLNSIRNLQKEKFFEASLLKNGKINKTIRKEAHPLVKYVHRMVMFYGGINPSMPTTTVFNLQDYVDETLGKDKLRVYLSSNGVEKIYKLLDTIADELCTKCGMDNNAILKHWKLR